MKKYILVLLMLVSPLMGQEAVQDDKKSLYFKTDIFTRFEGVSTIGNGTLVSAPVSLSGISFKFGVKKAYWYNQLRISTTMPSYKEIFGCILYGRRIGFLTGVGGVVKETSRITMNVDFGFGVDFSLDDTLEDFNYYGNSPGIPIAEYGVNWEINWTTHMFLTDTTKFFFGFNFGQVMLLSSNEEAFSIYGFRYGLSLGFSF